MIILCIKFKIFIKYYLKFMLIQKNFIIKNIKNPIVKLNRYNNPILPIKREI